ncbi:chemotaxis protein histidine kinase-like protein [Leptolyngbya sp. PCC 7375]|nr:chemotaxis protein histidine kinase-like protein [Leptolyngbya sp. PCC 7375]
MSSNQAILQPPPTYFQQEAAQLLQQIGDELQALSQNFSIQKAHTLMRLAHTLKGAAATVGLDVIKTITQALENAFKALCTPDANLTPTVKDLIFEGYNCLELMVSVRLAKEPIDESNMLDRIATIVSQLQENLGDRFGQDSYLPTSIELGVDVTQAIFESGVTDYLNELSQALKTPDPDSLKALLHIHADVFIGLAESLQLPGFGAIAKATLAALKQHPAQTVHIAHIALDDYRAGQTKVLQGDRNQGGAPSSALLQLGTQVPQRTNRLQGLWQWLNQPITMPRKAPQIQVAQPSSPPQTLPTKPISVVKKQPLTQVFLNCQENLSDLTRQHDKPVLVEIRENEVLIDQAIAQRLYDPLLQLVHYAFKQDLEMPTVRQRQGKSALGRIQLAAKQAEQHLVMCVWDDGYGLNPETPCQQVRPQIASLQGTVTAAYSPGKGTCFTLRIPLGTCRVHTSIGN